MGTVLMGAGVSSHMSIPTFLFLAVFFPPSVLTIRKSAFSLPPFVICFFFLSYIFTSFSISIYSILQHKSLRVTGGCASSSQRERKKIMIEKWFQPYISKDTEVSKSHRRKGVCAVNHSRPLPIIQHLRMVTQFLDKSVFKVVFVRENLTVLKRIQRFCRGQRRLSHAHTKGSKPCGLEQE